MSSHARSETRASKGNGHPWPAILIAGGFGLLLYLERRRPLRKEVESHLRHDTRNVVFASLTGAAVYLIERPIIQPLTKFVQRRRIGLLPMLGLPRPVETIMGVAFLDYTLYLWHILTHRMPFLWRFHSVHHADLDLGVSTAIRFHFAEITISIAYRAGQIFLIGIKPNTYSIWNTLLLLEVMFHHSNLELPVQLERVLSRFIVTPRMHGIHHSVIPDESNSNWSSGLTIWDWLHGTLRLDIPQDELIIGIPVYMDPAEVSLPKIIAMPFRPVPDYWKFPDGRAPERLEHHEGELQPGRLHY